MAWFSTTAPLALKIMLIVGIIFVPIVLACKAWTYRMFTDKIHREDLLHETC